MRKFDLLLKYQFYKLFIWPTCYVNSFLTLNLLRGLFLALNYLGVYLNNFSYDLLVLLGDTSLLNIS